MDQALTRRFTYFMLNFYNTAICSIILFPFYRRENQSAEGSAIHEDYIAAQRETWEKPHSERQNQDTKQGAAGIIVAGNTHI